MSKISNLTLALGALVLVGLPVGAAAQTGTDHGKQVRATHSGARMSEFRRSVGGAYAQSGRRFGGAGYAGVPAPYPYPPEATCGTLGSINDPVMTCW